MKIPVPCVLLAICLSNLVTAQGLLDYREVSLGFRLDEAIEKKILSRPNTEKILQINNIQTFRNNPSGEKEMPFQILVFDVSIELKEGWEAVWHGKMILAKKSEEKNWAHSHFIDSQWVDDSSKLRFLRNSEILKLIEKSANE